MTEVDYFSIVLPLLLHFFAIAEIAILDAILDALTCSHLSRVSSPSLILSSRSYTHITPFLGSGSHEFFAGTDGSGNPVVSMAGGSSRPLLYHTSTHLL
jgi:hypothetical protein